MKKIASQRKYDMRHEEHGPSFQQPPPQIFLSFASVRAM